MTSKVSENETTAGNYFVSNYPPYSFWKTEQTGEATKILESCPKSETPLGIYLHIPFCRKRCHFCYFKVYTDKNSSEIKRYLDALISEMSIYARKPFLNGRRPSFIYFGGGKWIRSRNLPNQYRNYNLYNGYKVVLNDYHGSRPYTHFKNHKVKY